MKITKIDVTTENNQIIDLAPNLLVIILNVNELTEKD